MFLARHGINSPEHSAGLIIALVSITKNFCMFIGSTKGKHLTVVDPPLTTQNGQFHCPYDLMKNICSRPSEIRSEYAVTS